jgi:hypothetical protein
MACRLSYTIYFLFIINLSACSQNKIITPEQNTPVFVNHHRQKDEKRRGQSQR